MKKKLTWLLVCTLVLTALLAACSKSNNGQEAGTSPAGSSSGKIEDMINPPGEYPIVKQPITLRTFFKFDANKNIKENGFTKHVEQLTNIRFDWDIATDDGFEEKKQLVIAGGNWPAVFLHGAFNKDEQIRYGSQGMLIPLNDLLEKYAPNVMAAFDEVSYLRASVTAPDGNIYAIPHVNECYHCSMSQKLWINSDWLDQLGLKMPTTTEELYNVLKAFKDKDPNGNGKPDEIPLSASASGGWRTEVDGFLMNPFIINDRDSYFAIEDGKLLMAASTPAWREGLLFMKRLYDEQLLDPQALIQTNDELRQIANNPDAVLVGAFPGGHPLAVLDGEPLERQIKYNVVPPLKGPEGKSATPSFAGIDSSGFAITKNATELEAIAAVRLLDYMYSFEGTMGDEFGVEDVFWHKPTGDEKDMRGRPAAFVVDPSFWTDLNQNENWGQRGPSFRSYSRFESRAASQDIYTTEGYEVRLLQATQLYEPHLPKEVFPTSMFMDQNDAEEIAHIKPNIVDYIRENMMQFVTGSKNIDKDWDSYVNGFKGLNVDRYIEIYQKAYDVYKQANQ